MFFSPLSIRKSASIFCFSLFFCALLPAQTDTVPAKDSIDYYEMSLEQLMNLKAHGIPSELEELINSLIAVASNKPLKTRESPNIISLVTEEEIRNSGARDLIDVLRLVPGFDFGVDVEGVVGMGLRGNWGHEGKILVLLDGQEMNEILFATTQFGNHFPIEHIKKIEILRGPGSAFYGGFAEYGVINIITRSGNDINGISASILQGLTSDDAGRRNFSLSTGKKINDFDFSLSGRMGEASRSGQDFTDLYGDSYNMAGNSDLNPTLLNMGMAYKGFSFRGILDNFSTLVQDGYDAVKPNPYQETFNSLFGELKYVHKFNPNFSITPRINFKRQVPWKTDAVDSLTSQYYKVADRYSGNLTISYNITRNINFILGAEAFRDQAWDMADSGLFSNGSNKVQYFNQAYFMQGLIKTWFLNFIIGARYDNHNVYGHAFVPRVGITKKYERFHFKALLGNSFRAPSIENINLATDVGVKPEKTMVGELELGYQFTRNLLFNFNIYDITTKDPIVYFYDAANNADTYINSGNSGSRGIEAELRLKKKWGYLVANYSFYTIAGKNRIADYEVPGNETQLLAFSPQSGNLFASVKLTKNISVNPSVVFRGKRWGFTSLDTLGNLIEEQFDPYTLINIFIRYENLGIEGLSLGAGVYDALDQKPPFIQPYNGAHAPLPGPSREWIFRLTYDFMFWKKIKKTGT